ncbi:MAG: hypothetical protein QW303_06445 [Nitrososphaerota archaeon]
MSNLTSFINVTTMGTSFNGTASPVGGITGSFGNPIILGIAGILIMLIIGVKMRVSFDLIALSCLTMIAILGSPTTVGSGILPDWIFWLFILGGGIILGLGLNKVIKNR